MSRFYKDPYIIVTGDFNQWDLTAALEDYPDLDEAPVGPTRQGRHIDRAITNFHTFTSKAGTLAPLESSDFTRASDHLVAFVEANLPRKEAYELLHYTYRLYTEQGAEDFINWATLHDWSKILVATGSNEKARLYQAHIDSAMDVHFPYVTTCLLYTSPSPRDS